MQSKMLVGVLSALFAMSLLFTLAVPRRPAPGEAEDVEGTAAEATAVSTEDQLRSDVARIVDEWLADEVPDAFAHLGGRLVGEGDGGDARGLHARLQDEMSDAVSDEPGLAGAGTGEHQQRPPGMRDGDPLLLVQLRKNPVGCCFQTIHPTLFPTGVRQ